MKLEDKKIILTTEEDYEMCMLIHHIVQLKYGTIKVLVKYSKPHQLFDIQKSTMLSKHFAKDNEINKSKDPSTYGD